jgi:hypothetical protein
VWVPVTLWDGQAKAQYASPLPFFASSAVNFKFRDNASGSQSVPHPYEESRTRPSSKPPPKLDAGGAAFPAPQTPMARAGRRRTSLWLLAQRLKHTWSPGQARLFPCWPSYLCLAPKQGDCKVPLCSDLKSESKNGADHASPLHFAINQDSIAETPKLKRFGVFSRSTNSSRQYHWHCW